MSLNRLPFRALLATLFPLGAALFIGACGEDSDPPVACTVTAPLECPDPAPRYPDVAPIFEARCSSAAACHAGAEGGPWPLNTYDDVSDWQDVIRAEVLHCTMPPPDSDMTISDQEREAILTWVKCGALE
ncbi:MAG TPA: hypothetical protein VG937_23345 [Polyangiaceae bacterium]|nr:hypothetical protein [Polyangiaceae bacterium]